jgi:hypothetical protein
MTVEILVNWKFVGEEDEALVTYGTSVRPPGQDDGEENAELPLLSSVVPLGSSVLAPGLSMPIPAS